MKYNSKTKKWHFDLGEYIIFAVGGLLIIGIIAVFVGFYLNPENNILRFK